MNIQHFTRLLVVTSSLSFASAQLNFFASAQAAETQTTPVPAKETPASAGTLTDTPAKNGFLNHFTMSLRIEGYGPSITDFSAYRPNAGKGITNDHGSEVYSKNKLSLGYKLGDTMTTGIGAQFYSYTQKGAVGQEPYAFVRDSKLVNAGNFNLDTAVKVYGGFTHVSQTYHTAGQLRVAGDATYKLGSDFTAGMIYENYWFMLSQRNLGSHALEFDLWPHVDARITDNFIASVIVKTWSYHNIGKGHSFVNHTDPVMLSPNLTYLFIHKTLAVNPYLDIPVKRIQARFTTVGLNLNWKVL